MLVAKDSVVSPIVLIFSLFAKTICFSIVRKDGLSLSGMD